MLPAHQQHGRVARGALAVATATFAKTMRVWIGLLNLTERLRNARPRKARVLVRAHARSVRPCACVTVTVTGPGRNEG
jgi:hypothetical protein